jgi:hypothetical protein
VGNTVLKINRPWLGDVITGFPSFSAGQTRWHRLENHPTFNSIPPLLKRSLSMGTVQNERLAPGFCAVRFQF